MRFIQLPTAVKYRIHIVTIDTITFPELLLFILIQLSNSHNGEIKRLD